MEKLEHFRRTWLGLECNSKPFICKYAIKTLDILEIHILKGCLENIPPKTGTSRTESLHRQLEAQSLKSQILVIGNLNINSISNKFGNLKLITHGKIGILVITETKTDWTFPLNQFAIQGYSKPYRFDRNRNGGDVFIYVREDIPSRESKIHNTPEDIESIFIEINLIETKWLFCGCYHRPSQSD